MTQFPEMENPELQQLMDLDAAERGESEFGAGSAGRLEDLDPDPGVVGDLGL